MAVTVQASAQGVKPLADAVLHRDSDTGARRSNEPMPDSDMDMNNIVTKEQCERITQAVLKELGLADRNNFVGVARSAQLGSIEYCSIE